MSEINIKLTEEQFKALQKLVYLGQWMLDSFNEEPENNFSAEHEVEQIVYALSDKTVSEYSKKFKMFFPTKEFEDEMHVHIEDYDGYTFWDELANQLAERDLRNELGNTYDKLDLMTRISKHEHYLQHYIREFTKNDLKNLVIK